MSLSQLPNGRWRAQVYDPSTGKNVSAAKVLDLPRGQGTFATKRQAKKAREMAREKLYAKDGKPVRREVTVGEFYDRWTSDRLFETGKKGPRKASTLATYHQGAKSFSDAYRNLPLSAVDDEIVGAWLARSKQHTVYALQIMFADAMSKKAGRLIQVNPWSNMGLSRGSRAHVQPPTIEQVNEMILHARRLTTDDFAAWLQFACFTGMRPGEIDGLERKNVLTGRRRVVVEQQWSGATRTMTSPKNGKSRTILLPPSAQEAVEGLPRQEFAFQTMRGKHFTPPTRTALWDRVRVAMDWYETDSRTVLYTATRHFAGWYFYEYLNMDAEDVAIQLGHEDHGDLVRRLYGHKDRDKALDRLEAAVLAKTDNVVQLRAVAS